MPKDVSYLEKAIDFSFHNKNILEQALIHRSYLNEHTRIKKQHNERLEFLGDAVLELVVTEYLFQHYDNPEGELTNWRAALVNAHKLAEVAHSIALDHFLYMSKGEEKDTTGKARQYILANALEALIGAIYLDQGWEATKKFVTDHIIIHLPYILEHKLYMDAKSKFQELVQELYAVTPTYREVSATGPDHQKEFVVGVCIGDEEIARGKGLSKQEAQMKAAETALKIKGWN